jgi:hypothetical protein
MDLTNDIKEKKRESRKTAPVSISAPGEFRSAQIMVESGNG